MSIVRSDVVRIYKSVHTWTGILCGMALFIAFYAGAITLFKEPLVHWATPPSRGAPATPLADAQALITQTLARHPAAAREFEIKLHRAAPELLEWTVTAEGADEHDGLSVRHFAATFESGALRAGEVHRSHLGELIDVLHRVVGLPVDGDATRLFMGVVATLYFVALFSGLVTLLPSLVKDLFALRVGPNLKRMWLDAHNVVGLGSLPFHLVMALTAATFAFHDAVYLAQNQLVHEGKLSALFGARGGPAGAAPRDPAEMVPPADILVSVKTAAPSFEPTVLRYMRVTGPGASVFVFGHDARGGLEQRALGGLAMVDPYTGKITNTAYLPGKHGVAETVLTSLFALHFGSYGGAPVKWLYFTLALLGAWLVYSGNLLWIESRRKREKPNVAPGVTPAQRRDTRIMASLTVGVCLGAVCGISLTIVSAKWLSGHVLDLNAWHRLLYYGAFFAALGWSFWRGGARAAVDLLRAAAALTSAIPLTSLLALTVPGTGMWVHTTPAALAVDGVALLVAGAFTWLARVTARRVHSGRVDSVWSAQVVAKSPSAEAVVAED